MHTPPAHVQTDPDGDIEASRYESVAHQCTDVEVDGEAGRRRPDTGIEGRDCERVEPSRMRWRARTIANSRQIKREAHINRRQRTRGNRLTCLSNERTPPNIQREGEYMRGTNCKVGQTSDEVNASTTSTNAEDPRNRSKQQNAPELALVQGARSTHIHLDRATQTNQDATHTLQTCSPIQ